MLSRNIYIGLRDDSYPDFTKGDVFITQDELADNRNFDKHIHCHTAQVIGENH